MPLSHLFGTDSAICLSSEGCTWHNSGYTCSRSSCPVFIHLFSCAYLVCHWCRCNDCLTHLGFHQKLVGPAAIQIIITTRRSMIRHEFIGWGQGTRVWEEGSDEEGKSRSRASSWWYPRDRSLRISVSCSLTRNIWQALCAFIIFYIFPTISQTWCQMAQSPEPWQGTHLPAISCCFWRLSVSLFDWWLLQSILDVCATLADFWLFQSASPSLFLSHIQMFVFTPWSLCPKQTCPCVIYLSITASSDCEWKPCDC